MNPEAAMETERPYGPVASVALVAAAVILVSVGVALAGERDPDRISLVVVALTVLGAIAYAVTNRHGTAYRAAVGVALVATFILFWGIGAVGFMGNDLEHPADLMYALVPVVGIIGAVIARFQPRGMAAAMFATALAQMLVPASAVIVGLNLMPISLSELVSFTLILNGPFAALYVGSALLFRKAAREQLPAGMSLAG
jgi:hypothetical protein